MGGRRGALLYAAALGLGLLPKAPGFRILQVRRVRIEGPADGIADGEPVQGEPVQGDGDGIATLPIEIALTDKTLRLVVP